MRTIGFNIFLSLLHKKMGGKYSVQQLEKVITGYCSPILSELNARQEVKDKYFGQFRLTEKGFISFCVETKPMAKEHLNIVRMDREKQKIKLRIEKKNRFRWAAQNLIEGYKYKSKSRKISMLRAKKAKTRNKQIKYILNNTNRQLKQERLIRTNRTTKI